MEYNYVGSKGRLVIQTGSVELGVCDEDIAVSITGRIRMEKSSCGQTYQISFHSLVGSIDANIV